MRNRFLIFFLIFHLFFFNLTSFILNSWCPKSQCYDNFCNIKILLIIIPNITKCDYILNILMNKLNQNEIRNSNGHIEIIKINDQHILFNLSEIFYKIDKMQKKTLAAFVHDKNLKMNYIQTILNNILSISATSSLLPSQTSLSSSSSSNSFLNHTIFTKIYLINSINYEIRSYDMLRKLFPCIRSIILKDPQYINLNSYIKKFFPNSYLMNTIHDIEKFDQWFIFDN